MPRLNEITQLGLIIQDEVTLGGLEIEAFPKHMERDGIEGLVRNNGDGKALRLRTEVFPHSLARVGHLGFGQRSKLLWRADDRLVEVNKACGLHPWRAEVDVSLHRIMWKASFFAVFVFFLFGKNGLPVLGFETEENQGFGHCLFFFLAEQPLFPFAISAHLDFVAGCYGKFIF